MTTTDGIFIGGELALEGDRTGPRSAQVVLSDPLVEVAVLETSRAGIVRRGLGYDWSDVGVITCINEDHVGRNGIKSINDIVFIKSLVVERVCAGGTLVMNADDDRVVGMLDPGVIRRENKRVFFFSLQADSAIIGKHLLFGGTAFLLEHGWLVERTRDSVRRIVAVSDLLATMTGIADFQIPNLLAAIAACRALKVSSTLIASYLSTLMNTGTSDLYKVNVGHVMVGYACGGPVQLAVTTGEPVVVPPFHFSADVVHSRRHVKPQPPPSSLTARSSSLLPFLKGR